MTYGNNYTLTNNRIQYWQYDADGRNTVDAEEGGESVYDAAGRLTTITNPMQSEAGRFYDGDGREGKRTERYYRQFRNGTRWINVNPKYFMRSTVLGGEVVTQINSDGRKARTLIYAAGAIVAEQKLSYYYNGEVGETINFQHGDASGMSVKTFTNGVLVENDGTENAPAELDPLGNNAGVQVFVPEIDVPEPVAPINDFFGDLNPLSIEGLRATCNLDGVAIDCQRAFNFLRNGAAIPAALAGIQHLRGFSFEDRGLGIFTVFIPGHYLRLPNAPDDEIIRVNTDWQEARFETYNFGNISLTPQQPIDYRSALRDFLDRNPNCLEILRAIARVSGRGEFNDFLDEGLIIDTELNPEFLDKTGEQLGGVSFLPENLRTQTLRDILNPKLKDPFTGIELPIPAAAATIPDTGTIFVAPAIKTANVGLIIFHEKLHAFFKGNHIDILTGLNLPVPKIDRRSGPSDSLSSQRLDEFLARGCR